MDQLEIDYLYEKIFDFAVEPFSKYSSEDIYHMSLYLFPYLLAYKKSQNIEATSIYLVALVLLRLSIKLNYFSRSIFKCLNYVLRKNIPSSEINNIQQFTKSNIIFYKEMSPNNLCNFKQIISPKEKSLLSLKMRYRMSLAQSKHVEKNIVNSVFCYNCESYTDFFWNPSIFAKKKRHSHLVADIIPDLVFPKLESLQFLIRCNLCLSPFVFSQLSFDILPLAIIVPKNITTSLKRSDQDKIRKIYSDQELQDMDDKGEIYQIKNQLYNENSEDNDEQPKYFIFINTLPADISIIQCNYCQKLFYSEEWELHVIQNKNCPFCNTTQKYPPEL